MMNDITSNSVALSRTLIDMEDTRLIDRRVQGLRQCLTELGMVSAMSQVAREHNLSAPLVQAFHSIPGFNQAVANFPSAQGFNIVPEHSTALQNVAGLEAFDAARDSAFENLRAKGSEVSSAVAIILRASDPVISDLRAIVADARTRLEQSDVTDEVLEGLHVQALTQENYITLFTHLEQCASALVPFNTDNLRAYPNQIAEELAGLEALVDQVGITLGVKLDQFGLVESDGSNEFHNTEDTFEAKNLTKTAMLHHLAQAASLLDNLQVVVDRADEMKESADQELTSMPIVAETTDAEFGYVDHARLFMSHSMMTAKVLRESFLAVSGIVAAANTALNIKHGFDA